MLYWYIAFFLTATWLPHSQLWVIAEGVSSITWLWSLHFYSSFNPKVTRSLVAKLGASVSYRVFHTPLGLPSKFDGGEGGGGLNQYMREHGGLKMVLKSTCEGVQLSVKLPAICLQAYKFTKTWTSSHIFSKDFS